MPQADGVSRGIWGKQAAVKRLATACASLPALFALLAVACAPEHGNILTGTWQLSHYLCDGEREDLPADYQLRLIFANDGSFIARLTDTGAACDVDFTGTYSREGLNVRETAEFVVCAGVCNVPAAGESAAVNCAGAGTTPIPDGQNTHDYFLNAGVIDLISETGHSPAQYCLSGKTEEQVFTRVD